jgi:hypothetical protein
MTNIAEKIMAAIIESGNTYCHYGLRTDDLELTIGQELDWSIDGSYEGETATAETGEQVYLNGTCATGFGFLWYDEDDREAVEKAVNTNSEYIGKHKYLIAGSSCEYGDDTDEIIIPDAVVVAIIY